MKPAKRRAREIVECVFISFYENRARNMTHRRGAKAPERIAGARAEIGDLRTVELERERDLSRVDIPALSPAAETVLSRIRDAIDRNDLSSGLSFLLADKMVEAELGEVAAKLDRRFGERTFMAGMKPEGPAFEKASARVAAQDRTKLIDAWPKFNAIQKIDAQKRAKQRSDEKAQAQALKKDLSKDRGMTR